MQYRKIVVAFCATLLMGLGITLSTPFNAKATVEEKHHLLYDSVDKVWRCVGSASNCAF